MLGELIHHTHTPYSLLIDIGSGSVGVAILEKSPDSKEPLIIYTHRERIRITKGKTADEFIRTLREALLAATLELSSEGMKKLRDHHTTAQIDHIDVLYASPWSDLATRVITLEHKEPFAATPHLVDELIAEALKKSDTSATEQAIFDATGYTIINRDVIDSTLNGYPIHTFKGQMGTEISIVYLSELVPEPVRATLREAEKNLSAHAPIHESTFARAAYSATRALYPDISDALIIEVTGEATECIVMQNGILRHNYSTLFGTHSLYRLLAEKLNTIEEEAASHIEAYVAKTLHEEVREPISMIRESYKEHLRRIIHETEAHYPIPNDLIIILDEKTAPFFSEMIEETYAVERSDYSAHILDEEMLAPLVLYKDGIQHDRYISIGAFFFHTKNLHNHEA